jgi:hypothetical protein
VVDDQRAAGGEGEEGGQREACGTRGELAGQRAEVQI